MSRGRDKFKKYQAAINLLVKWYKMFPCKIRYKKLERNRFTRGYIGQVKRYALVKSIAKSVGSNVSIKEGVFLYHINEMVIGNNVSIWPLSYIDAIGGLTIGNDVSIAHGTSILTFEHQYEAHNIPIKDQEVKILPVAIEDNVWIGAKATILSGVHIASGSVIGAGAVITKDVDENTIVVGIPGKKIKDR